MQCDRLLLNATLIDESGMQHQNQAIAILNGRIIWCGQTKNLAVDYLKNASIVEDCKEKLITPALIDCHTHLVYAGNRANEFKLRLNGASYLEIAKNGGGILSTVRDTREASDEQLLRQSLPRILALKAEGVLTVEIKSGYGLNLPTELKMLRVAKALGRHAGVRVRTTFLGAHAVPPEFVGKNQDYVDYLCSDVMPAVAEEGLADSVDVFCETIGFSLKQTEQLFLKAHELKLAVKCHADQLSNMGATTLATRFKALSVDHLEHLDKVGVLAMKQANTVGVLLPGAYYFLRETRKPPIELLRDFGVGMAIATDCNPGTSPTTSLRLMMNMACQFFSLTVAEVLSGVTHQAARALSLQNEIGSIKIGKKAELIRWSVSDSAELCAIFGYPLAHETMVAGSWLRDGE